MAYPARLCITYTLEGEGAPSVTPSEGAAGAAVEGSPAGRPGGCEPGGGCHPERRPKAAVEGSPAGRPGGCEAGGGCHPERRPKAAVEGSPVGRPGGCEAESQLLLVDLSGGPCAVDLPAMQVRLEAAEQPAAPASEQPASVESESITLCVTPTLPLRIQSAALEYAVDADAYDAVLCNGYQSWTDTAERGIWDAMRGLNGVPQAVVNRYVLDGGGDYRFTNYPNEPGVQHGWTYAYLRNDSECFLAASLDESRGFTLLRVDAACSTLRVEPEPPQGALDAGGETCLARIALVRASCANAAPDACVRAAHDRWFELSGTVCRPALPLAGYTSWYRHYDGIDEAKLLADLEGAAAAFAKLDAHGFTKVFQIDDGYAPVGDWLQLRDERFPNGMKALAGAIADAGFTPGLWAAPFVCERESAVFVQHPDWLLRDADGNRVSTGCHWGGAFALDTRNPEVRAYVQHAVRTMVEDWGFRLLKLDFVYGACMLPHDGMNRGQLMADAMALLREAAGDAAILACGVPLGAAFGVVEYCRIGCDVGLDWDDVPYMRLLHRERVSTKNSLTNTVYRAPLNGRAFLCDPDVLFMRPDVRLSHTQRQMLIEGDACFGGALLTSDDMGAWTDGQLATYQQALDLQREALK